MKQHDENAVASSLPLCRPFKRLSVCLPLPPPLPSRSVQFRLFVDPFCRVRCIFFVVAVVVVGGSAALPRPSAEGQSLERWPLNSVAQFRSRLVMWNLCTSHTKLTDRRTRGSGKREITGRNWDVDGRCIENRPTTKVCGIYLFTFEEAEIRTKAIDYWAVGGHLERWPAFSGKCLQSRLFSFLFASIRPVNQCAPMSHQVAAFQS